MTTDLQPPENFDGDVYWYRRLPSHPRPGFEAAARDFRDAVAKDLGLTELYPEIVWYDPMEHFEAATKWLAATREHPNAGWDINDNPFTTPVDVFRFPKQEAETAVHGGFTPNNGPNLIGILAAQPPDLVFECIAHECVHVRQNEREGRGWRMENLSKAETEAWEYQRQSKCRFRQYFETLQSSK
jgi:hypothetical protein